METKDLIVIGGGINGAGIAADAAGRGLSVLMLEARDLACATSSASLENMKLMPKITADVSAASSVINSLLYMITSSFTINCSLKLYSAPGIHRVAFWRRIGT